jgi:hypothetical protein
VEANRRRSRNEFEYELLDTGVFNDDRYFDVFVEYAKASPEDILIRITAYNRGTEEAELHVLPTLWFRNDWAPWIVARRGEKPLLKQIDGPAGASAIAATHSVLGTNDLYCEGGAPLLFTENSTNHTRLHLDYPDDGRYLKDGINDYVVQGRHDAVNPERHGTKAAAHYRLPIGPGQSATVEPRPIPLEPQDLTPPCACGKQEANRQHHTRVLTVDLDRLGLPLLHSEPHALAPDGLRVSTWLARDVKSQTEPAQTSEHRLPVHGPSDVPCGPRSSSKS